MLPIGDSPNPKGIAWVTMILIGLNILVYVMLLPQMSEPADPEDPRYGPYVKMLQSEGALPSGPDAELPDARRPMPQVQITEYDLTVYEHGSRPASWTWLSMLTSMFLHGGLMHLLGNMLFLWIYGNNVEHRLGRMWYLIAYLATGFIASWGDILLRPGSEMPGVGASGAISGVLGLYFIWFPKNKVRMLILMPQMMRQVEVGARWVLGFYIVVQNIIPAFAAAYSETGGGGGVAHGAHIGGFVGGIAVAFLANWRVMLWPEQKDQPEGSHQPGELTAARAAPGGTLGQLRRELDAGNVAAAARLFFEAPGDLAHEGLEPRDALRLADDLAAAGEARGALAAYDRALELNPKGELLAAAHLGAATMLAGSLRQATSAYQHLVAALEAGPSDIQIEESRRIMAQIRPQVKSLPRVFA